jgi:outer membrane protein
MVVAAALLSLALPCEAQTERHTTSWESKWSVRGGFTDVAPAGGTGELTPSPLADARFNLLSKPQFSAGLNYRLGDSWALDVPLSLPHRHEIEGRGALSAEREIGSVDAWPLTALVQYRFQPRWEVFRPYLVAGVTWTRFSGGSMDLPGDAAGSAGPVSTGLKMPSQWGASAGLGLEYDFNRHIYFDLRILQTRVSSRASLNATGQSFEVDFNPMSFTTSAGWRF